MDHCHYALIDLTATHFACLLSQKYIIRHFWAHYEALSQVHCRLIVQQSFPHRTCRIKIHSASQGRACEGENIFTGYIYKEVSLCFIWEVLITLLR